MVKPPRKSSTKNPPIFSQEFIIQNHADIISCIAMVIVAGLMVQVTVPVSSVFVTLQHNITDVGDIPFFTTGVKDFAAIFFYSLICIVIHAVIQEYILDKVSKKLHLSKSKLAIFNTSGQLSIFYGICTAWGIDIILKEHFIPDVSLLWTGYPAPLSFLSKLFLIVQLSYYVHELPEIYFQRTKKEEYVDKASQSLTTLILIGIPYFLNFNRLLICILVLHYISEFLNHGCKLFQIIDKDEAYTKIARIVSTALVILARLATIVLSIVTLWYGFANSEQHPANAAVGNYNTLQVRICLLVIILVLQLYLTSTFLGEEVAQVRENATYNPAQRTKLSKKDKNKKPKRNSADESDLPEVDQNTNKNIKSRAQKAK